MAISLVEGPARSRWSGGRLPLPGRRSSIAAPVLSTERRRWRGFSQRCSLRASLRSTGGSIRVRSGYAVPTVAHLQYSVEPASTFCRNRTPGNDGEPLLLGTKLTACRLE